MTIKKVGVLGCGLMGSGIAQVAATAGFDVTVLEVEQKFLDKGFAGIEKSLASLPSGRRRRAASRAAEGRNARAAEGDDQARKTSPIATSSSKPSLRMSTQKKEMYAALDEIVKKDAIFASNTSSISITELMTATKRPERFIGLHFFNPVPLMKLVEVVRTIATADDVYRHRLRVREEAGQSSGAHQRQDRIHRQPAAGAVPARRHPRLRRGRRLDRGHRQRDEARLRLSHGPVHAARFRRPRHDLLHHACDVRRVQRAALRLASAAEAAGDGRLVRAEVGEGLLRLFGPEQSEGE